MCNYDDNYGDNRKSRNKFNSPICRFLRNLRAGDDVDTLIIGGQTFDVDAFVSFDNRTGTATFVQNNGAVFVVGCDQLDAVIIDQ